MKRIVEDCRILTKRAELERADASAFLGFCEFCGANLNIDKNKYLFAKTKMHATLSASPKRQTNGKM